MTAAWPSNLATVLVGWAPTESQYCTRLMSSPMCLLPSFSAHCTLDLWTTGKADVMCPFLFGMTARRPPDGRRGDMISTHSFLLWVARSARPQRSSETYQERDCSGQGSRCASHPLGSESPQRRSYRKADSAGARLKCSVAASLDRFAVRKQDMSSNGAYLPPKPGQPQSDRHALLGSLRSCGAYAIR